MHRAGESSESEDIPAQCCHFLCRCLCTPHDALINATCYGTYRHGPPHESPPRSWGCETDNMWLRGRQTVRKPRASGTEDTLPAGETTFAIVTRDEASLAPAHSHFEDAQTLSSWGEESGYIPSHHRLRLAQGTAVCQIRYLLPSSQSSCSVEINTTVLIYQTERPSQGRKSTFPWHSPEKSSARPGTSTCLSPARVPAASCRRPSHPAFPESPTSPAHHQQSEHPLKNHRALRRAPYRHRERVLKKHLSAFQLQ